MPRLVPLPGAETARPSALAAWLGVGLGLGLGFGLEVGVGVGLGLEPGSGLGSGLGLGLGWGRIGLGLGLGCLALEECPEDGRLLLERRLEQGRQLLLVA